MNFLNKLSPMKVAVVVALVLSLFASLIIHFFYNSDLSERMYGIVFAASNRIQQGEPNITTLTDTAQKLNLDYIALYKGQEEQPFIHIGDNQNSIFNAILPASSKKHELIENTPYYADITLAQREYAPLFLVIISLTLLVLFLGTIFVASLLKNRTQEKILKLREAINNKEFDNCDDKEIANILKNSYHEYDSRIAELKKDNERLKNLVDQDSLTDVNNRKKFRKDLAMILTNTKEAALSVLAIIRATELTNINQSRGFARGDIYLQEIAKIIEDIVNKFTASKSDDPNKLQPSVYRLSGSDFAIIIPNSSTNIAHMLIKELKYAFDIYMQEHELESAAYAGVTMIRPSQTAETVMSRADRALSEAQTSSVNSGFFKDDKDDTDENVQGESKWKTIIQEIMDQNAIILLQQPIQSLNFSVRTYNEIFSRFVNKDGEMYPTETVFAMAQRHDMLLALEKKVIEIAIDKFTTNNFTNQRWGINLSINALLNASFVVWLERQLLKNANIADNFVFEISENILDCNLTASIRLFDMFRRVNVRSCISKFGNGLGSFRLYRELKPDFIKLDPSLVDTLERDHSSQMFVRMIVEVSHRLGCVVIAEGVEEYSQKQMLETMYIDGVQGYLIAKPASLLTGDGTDPVSDTNNQGVGNDNSNVILGG